MTTETRRETPNAAPRIARAWQEGAQTLFSGYGEQLRRFTEAGAAFYQPGLLARPELRETFQKIAEGTREVTTAQVAVAGEWLRAPLWLTGAASPADLQARYTRLFEAQRELARTYLDAALGWQRSITGAAEKATEVARDAVDARTRTARAVAKDVSEAQQATVEATRTVARTAADSAATTARTAAETANTAVRQAREVAKEAAEQAELAVRPVKGTIRGEDKIYHLPGQSSYERTEPDETFVNEAAARAAGFRRAQTPGGGRIRGNINREGERIYHMPGQANYDRVEAEFLFETEELAQAAGFRASQR